MGSLLVFLSTLVTLTVVVNVSQRDAQARGPSRRSLDSHCAEQYSNEQPQYAIVVSAARPGRCASGCLWSVSLSSAQRSWLLQRNAPGRAVFSLRCICSHRGACRQRRTVRSGPCVRRKPAAEAGSAQCAECL